MATIKQFEDLYCWQKARELANFVFDVTDKAAFKDFDLKRQIRRAAVSVMSNIAEGFGRGTKAELINGLYISRGEVSETRSQLYIARDRSYIDRQTLERGLGLADECASLVSSFSSKVKQSSVRGTQFKP